MTDYISRQEASDALWQEREMLDSLMDEYLDKGMPIMRSNAKIERNRVDNDIFIIDQLPAAPVQEVKRGKWLDGYCSCCGERTVWDETDYCPNCGACMDMRGEE